MTHPTDTAKPGMTVSELIRELEKKPGGFYVLLETDDGGHAHAGSVNSTLEEAENGVLITRAKKAKP